MYGTITLVETYTRVDVSKVFEGFEADLRMLARRTKTQTQKWAEQTANDILQFAQMKYIEEVNIVLFNEYGRKTHAKRYQVNTDATGWENQRPSNNNWPATPGGQLTTIMTYSGKWGELSQSYKKNFKSKLKRSWGPTDIDTTHSGMYSGNRRHYASKGYGLERTDFWS